MRHHDLLNHRLYIAPSSIHGQGCFARISFDRGAFIGTFTGTEVLEDGPHVLWFYDSVTQKLHRRRGDNVLRWLNHSAQPNAVFNGFDLYAQRPIAADTELTIDYNGASGLA